MEPQLRTEVCLVALDTIRSRLETWLPGDTISLLQKKARWSNGSNRRGRIYSSWLGTGSNWQHLRGCPLASSPHMSNLGIVILGDEHKENVHGRLEGGQEGQACICTYHLEVFDKRGCVDSKVSICRWILPWFVSIPSFEVFPTAADQHAPIK